RIHVELLNEEDKVIGSAAMALSEAEGWQSAKAELVASETSAKGKLNVWIEGKGTSSFDMISLFPKET
ncbi:hypothetical protein UE99_040850, partial [Burkholderia cenocepacia]